MSKRTSSNSNSSDIEINNERIKKIKVYKNIEAKEISPRHPGLTKKYNQLFINYKLNYTYLIKFIHSKGLYSLTNNEIGVTRQNIEEAKTFNCGFFSQSMNDTLLDDILIFLKKFKKEILNDLKNWYENLELPEIDPQRKLLRMYINDIVDVLLKRPELDNTIMDIIVKRKINDNDMNIILNNIHKDDDLNYYKDYLKYMLSKHHVALIEILSKKLIFKIRENATSHPNKQDGFSQQLNQLASSNKNDNTPSNNENNIISKNESKSLLNQQKNIETSNSGTIKTKKVSSRHPGLTKNHFELFFKSEIHYIHLIRFIHLNGLYSLTNNEITLLTRQHIEEAIEFIFTLSDQQINDTFSNYILIFLKKYHEEILADLKNWHEHKKLPETDPQRIFLRIYINNIVDVLLRRQEFNTIIINILRYQSIEDIDMNTVLHEIHKNDLDYYRNYLKYILSHYKYMVEILCQRLLLKLRKNATNHQNKQDGQTQPSNQSAVSNENISIPSINKNDVSKNESESQLNQQKSAEDTVDLKLQQKIVDNNSRNSIVNKLSSQIPENTISSINLIEARESSEMTSSQIIDSMTENFGNQKPPIMNNDIIIIDDSDDRLKPNVKPEKSNEDDDITSEIFDALMNNEILLEWDEIKDKYLIKFILDNPDDLQEDCTFNKLLTLKPQMFEGFKAENLRKRKDHLANNFSYLIKLCGFEKIKTDEQKVVFNKRIESLRKLMNLSIKMEVY